MCRLFQLLSSWMDVSSHNVEVPALSIKNPDCHGYLLKVGNRHRTWRRRYCVLKYACLYYYVEASSTTAKGTRRIFGTSLLILKIAVFAIFKVPEFKTGTGTVLTAFVPTPSHRILTV